MGCGVAIPLPGAVVVVAALVVVVNVVGAPGAAVVGSGSGSAPQFCSIQYEFPVMKVHDEDKIGF